MSLILTQGLRKDLFSCFLGWKESLGLWVGLLSLLVSPWTLTWTLTGLLACLWDSSLRRVGCTSSTNRDSVWVLKYQTHLCPSCWWRRCFVPGWRWLSGLGQLNTGLSSLKYTQSLRSPQELQEVRALIFLVSFDTLAEFRTSRHHWSSISLKEDWYRKESLSKLSLLPEVTDRLFGEYLDFLNRRLEWEFCL